MSDPTVEFPVVAGLNTACAERSLGGDKELFLTLLASFSEEFAEAASQVEECLARDDIEGAALRLHALRGGASYIGADELVAAAKALETAILERQPQQEPLVTAFVEKHRFVLDALKATLNETSLSGT